MKRFILALLLAVFLSVSCIPCAATDTVVPKVREYTGFSDVPEGSWCYDAVKLCYEAGLLNGTSDTAFDPRGQLTGAQLMVLLDRLYNLQASGSPEIPALPEHPDSYVRFYDGEILVADFGDFTAMGYGPHQITFSFSKEDITLGQTELRIEIGVAGAPPEIVGEGKLDSDTTVYESHEYDKESGSDTVTAIPVTRYIFELGEDVDGGDLWDHLIWYAANTDYYADIWDEWWFPAVYDLVFRQEADITSLSTAHMDDPESDTNTPVWREDFAVALWCVCPNLEAIKHITAIPDIDPADYPAPYEDNPAVILALYNAGILTGVDAQGSFNGSGTLTRGQAAVILARVLDPALRIGAKGSP